MSIQFNKLQAMLTPRKPQDAKTTQKVIRVQIRCLDALVAIINDPINERLTLIIDGWGRLGISNFDQLIDFSSAFTGHEPVCRYEVGYGQQGSVATIIAWCEPHSEEGFLRMLVNSDGFVGNGYEDLRLFGDRQMSHYYDPALRERLAERTSVPLV